MRELSLHILDIVQNSLAAGASRIFVSVSEDTLEDRFKIIITDNGRGMTEEEKGRVLDPFYTTRTTRKVGLGLPLLQANARLCGGDLSVESSPGQGTTVKAEFQLSHVDRQPLGDLNSTFITLVGGAPEVDFVFEHLRDGQGYVVNTAEIRELLEDLPLNHPEVLAWLKKYLQEKEDLLPGTGRI